MPVEEVINILQTNTDTGLALDNIDEKRSIYGLNELPKIKKSLWKIYLAPIFNILIIILIFTGIFVILLGDYGSAIFTFLIVLANSITVIIQQYRAQKVLKALHEIAALKTTVLRDGIQFEIPTKEVLPGEIIILEQGDKIPADARIIEATHLSVDEAALTGESQPVEKKIEPLNDEFLPIQEQSNIIFMGTYINTGRAKAVVYGTGINTEIGKISHQINEMGAVEDIPLTRKLNRLGLILGSLLISILIILIIYKLSILAIQGNFYGSFITEALTSSILRAMNVMPINLPLLSTLVLITGVLNMAQSGVIVKNLAAIESLGRVSVICSDKTGTITKNEMSVEKFWINKTEYEVSGSGYYSEGEIFLEGEIINLSNNKTFKRFIEAIVLNNNSKLIFEDVKIHLPHQREKAIRKAIGSPTEASLIVLAEKSGINPYDIRTEYNILQEYPFDSAIKQMSIICQKKNEGNENIVFSKGAPEKLLLNSSKIELNGVINEISNEMKEQITQKISKRADQGYRILAVAYKNLIYSPKISRDTVEEDLIFLGFLSIMDPIRIGVRESVSECKSGGIKVSMITGDHPNTAKTIAAQSGIYKQEDLVVKGSEVESLSDDEFERVSVFARVAPRDKEVVVRRYQGQNNKKKHVVAMTGDGVNDSLALKLADAGISMGITGTDVSKEISDLVISDDNFTSIEKGVRTGRGLFAKIRNIIYFFICLNLMEAAVFFTYEFIPAFELFVSEWQHIYIYGIVHSLPSIALVIDSHPKDVMNEPPRDEEQLLNRNMWLMLIINAFLMGIGLVLAIQLTLEGMIPLNEWNVNPLLSYIPSGATIQETIAQKARTMLITTIYITETTFIWSFRRPNRSIFQSVKNEFNVSLFLITFFTLAIHILHINFSYSVNLYVNDIWGLNLQVNFLYLSTSDWLVCVLLSSIGIFGLEIFKYLARKKGIKF